MTYLDYASYYLSLLIPVLSLIGFLLFTFPKDMKIAGADFGTKNRWQRLNKKGKRFIIYSFFGLVLAEAGFIVNNLKKDTPKDKKLESADKIVYVPQIIRDTPKIKEKYIDKTIIPVMDLLTELQNPRIVGTSLDSLKTQFDIGVINDGIAYDIRDKFIYFFIYKGQLKLIKITNRAINESQKAYKKSDKRISIPITFPPSTNVDTTYFYLKVLYSNKPVGGRDQYPIKKIFYLALRLPFRSIEDIMNFKEVENQDQYDSLKRKLIANGYW